MAADKTPRAIHHVDVPGYPAAHSPYSHAVVANGFVFVSGQIPVKPGGGPTIGIWLRAHASAPCLPSAEEGARYTANDGSRGGDISLLTHYAHRCRAAVDHIEFTRRRAAHVDNSTATIRTAIGDADDYRLAIASVGHQHLRAKRQCPMSSSKSVRTGYFAACGLPAAIECGKTAFSMNCTDRYR